MFKPRSSRHLTFATDSDICHKTSFKKFYMKMKIFHANYILVLYFLRQIFLKMQVSVAEMIIESK